MIRWRTSLLLVLLVTLCACAGLAQTAAAAGESIPVGDVSGGISVGTGLGLGGGGLAANPIRGFVA